MNENKIYIPPIKIQGIKTKLVPLIRQKALVSEGTTWVEPFMGSGVVGFNIAAHKAIFADINPHIINFYTAVKNGTVTHASARAHLEKEGALLEKWDGEHYYFIRDRFNAEHQPLDFLFLNRACFNGMIRFNKKLQFNVPYGHKPARFSKAYITKITNQIRHVEELLAVRDWQFLCRPFGETIENAPAGSFIYCDPPYIGRHVDYYDNWDETQEAELCRVLEKSGMPFMLSTWDHNRYRANQYIPLIWGACHKTTQEHFYHVGAHEVNRNPMLEALLTNYTADIPATPRSLSPTAGA